MNPSERMKQEVSLLGELQRRGVQVVGSGNQRAAKCPFHEDNRASFSINITEGLWKCHAGCGAGSVIDLVALFDKTTPDAVIKRWLKENGNGAHDAEVRKPTDHGKVVATYSYRDESGGEVYRVERYEPKDFRPFRPNDEGKWILGLGDVERVLYNLPAVTKAERVIVVEGEKDVDNLTALGYVATCNVGGAGKWLEGYTESLEGKEIIICGDKDEPGRNHVKLVHKMILEKVKSIRTIWAPDPHKDISDYIPTVSAEDAKKGIDELINAAPVIEGGFQNPLQSFRSLEADFIEFTKNLKDNRLTLSNWLPTLGKISVGMVPGEVMTFVADTGVGKTALLCNLAIHAYPMPSILFELELPGTMIFQRVMATVSRIAAAEVQSSYAKGDRLGEAEFARVDHISVCSSAGLTPERIEKIIKRSELVTGKKPKLVLLDYAQLCLTASSSRYERMSDVAETIKVIAKRTNTIFIVASQVHRKEEGPEIGLHDAKGSGSIENSSGLVVGVWRHPEFVDKLVLKVLKNTKGILGDKIIAEVDWDTMRIWEQTSIYQ